VAFPSASAGGFFKEKKMGKKTLSELDKLLGDFDEEDDEDAEQLVSVLIDLAPCAGIGLMHNGRQYLHGCRYTVPVSVAADLGEMERRGHSHEASIHEPETRGRRRMNLNAHTPIKGPLASAIQSYNI
jgi:hypothetical protein